MIANNLLRKKRKELKDKTENAKKVEKEYVLVKQATSDLAKLFKSYEADVSDWKYKKHEWMNECVSILWLMGLLFL
jgi:hypothetical protein